MPRNNTSPILGHSAIRLVHQFRSKFKYDDRHEKLGPLTLLDTMRFRHSDTNEYLSQRKKCRVKQICLTGYSSIENTSVCMRLGQRRIRLQDARHVSLGISLPFLG
jgi:hypothetical protein